MNLEEAQESTKIEGSRMTGILSRNRGLYRAAPGTIEHCTEEMQALQNLEMNSRKSSSDMWEKIEINKDLVENALALAKRDVKTAENVFKDGGYDWCLSIAYNAMPQAGRALMFSEGYRPKGKFQHAAVVEFVKSRLVRSLQIVHCLSSTRQERRDIQQFMNRLT